MKSGFLNLSPSRSLHQKIGPAPPEFFASGTGEHAFDFSNNRRRLQGRLSPGSRAVKKQADNRCVLGPGKLFGHPFETPRNRHAPWQMKHALGQFDESLEMRSAASQYKSGGNQR